VWPPRRLSSLPSTESFASTLLRSTKGGTQRTPPPPLGVSWLLVLVPNADSHSTTRRVWCQDHFVARGDGGRWSWCVPVHRIQSGRDRYIYLVTWLGLAASAACWPSPLNCWICIAVKIRLQVQRSQTPSDSGKSALRIVQELGVRGLYKGLPATLLRDGSFSFLFFPIYANIRRVWLQDQRVRGWSHVSSCALRDSLDSAFDGEGESLPSR
jgi:hypothetical protein